MSPQLPAKRLAAAKSQTTEAGMESGQHCRRMNLASLPLKCLPPTPSSSSCQTNEARSQGLFRSCVINPNYFCGERFPEERQMVINRYLRARLKFSGWHRLQVSKKLRVRFPNQLLRSAFLNIGQRQHSLLVVNRQDDAMSFARKRRMCEDTGVGETARKQQKCADDFRD